MVKVLILGGSGMLGSAMVSTFQDFDGEVYATFRSTSRKPQLGSVQALEFEARDDLKSLVGSLGFGPADFVINCIGMVKAHIDDTSQSSRIQAIQLNTLLPQRIAEAVTHSGSRAIQIATDCVFSGASGSYDETSQHDPFDVYGKTKSLGEVPNSSFMHIRASIIGRELSGHTSLVSWVSNLPPHAMAVAYSNHYWNGVGALHFAKVCRGVIVAEIFRAGVSHLLPRDVVTKGELVKLIARRLAREDIYFDYAPAPKLIDRTLGTVDPKYSEELWAAAGYPTAPSIAELVAEI